MTAAFYKLSYDISYYYALTVLLIYLFTGKTVPAEGFALLLTGAFFLLLAEFMQGKRRLVIAFRIAGGLLPLTALFFMEEAFFALHLLAAYGYLLYTVIKKQYYAYYLNLQFQTKAALVLYGLLALLSTLKIEAEVLALSLAAPYLALFCTLAVLLFRLLRMERATEALQKTPEYFKTQLKQMSGFFLLCLAVTVGKVFLRLVLAGIRLLGELVKPLLVPLGILWKKVTAWIAALLADIRLSRMQIEGTLGEETVTQVPFPDYSGEPAKEVVTDSDSLFVLFAVLVTAVVLVALFKLLRGAKRPQRPKAAVVESRERFVPEQKKKRAAKLFGRRTERQRIKDCYAEFLRLCQKKKIGRAISDTSTEVYEKYSRAEAQELKKQEAAKTLSALYREARYCERGEIKEEKAALAKKLLKELNS